MSIHRSAGAWLRRAAAKDIPAMRSRGVRLRLRGAAALLGFGAVVASQPLAIGAGGDGGERASLHETTGNKATVRLAEVSSQVDASATRVANLTELLRAEVEGALSSIDWSKADLRRSYLVSASVVRLDSSASDRRQSASCVVSTTLRDERGSILAMFQGRARADDGEAFAERAERDALSAAARGAVNRIPEVIRRMQ